MIYIATTEANGTAVYFDIHATERQGRGLRISGLVGDGDYEGEVLVETGREVVVTFVDAWLGGAGFHDFMQRCGAEKLEAALVESVLDLPMFHGRRELPHGYAVTQGGSLSAEATPFWLVNA